MNFFVAFILFSSLAYATAQSCTYFPDCSALGSSTVMGCVNGLCECNPGFSGGYYPNGTIVPCYCPSGMTEFTSTQLRRIFHGPPGYACLAPGQCMGAGGSGGNCAWWENCNAGSAVTGDCV